MIRHRLAGPNVLMAVAGILSLLLAIGTLAAPARAFPTLTWGNVTETPVDLDNDGHYDWLQFQVSLNVTAAGNFSFWWTLASPVPAGSRTPPAFSTGGSLREFLGLGAQTVTFKAYGPLIYLSKTDGPYNLTVDAFACGISCGFYPPISHVTAAYRATQFDPPAATFGSPIADFGRDLNGDGLYDQLVLQVPLVVVRPVVVSLNAWTSLPSQGSVYLTFDGGGPRQLCGGTYVWQLTLPGLLLRHYQANMSYNISISVTEDNVSGLPSTSHLTVEYDWPQFSLPSASIRGTVTAEPTDLNATGRAGRLLLHVPLHVEWPGDYMVDARLSAGTNTIPYVEAHAARQLNPGNTTVTLSFSGITINRLPADGPFLVFLDVAPAGGAWYDQVSTSVTTPPFLRSQFVSAPEMFVNLNFNTQFPAVWVLDPNQGLVVTFYLGLYQAPPYPYQLTLYPGNFVLVVFDHTNGWSGGPSIAIPLNVSGNMTLNVTVPPPVTSSFHATFDFAGSNETTEIVNYTFVSDAPMLRLIADVWGNMDGYANSSEIAAVAPYSRMASGVSFPGVTYLPGLAPAGPVVADGVQMSYPVLRTLTAQDGGRLTSSGPINVTVAGTWTTGNPPAPVSSHTLTLSLNPSSSAATAAYRIVLPAGSSATVTASGGVLLEVGPREWILSPATGSTAPVAVTIQGAFPGETSCPAENPGGAGLQFVTLTAVAILVAAVATGALLLWRRRRPPREEREREKA